MNRPDIEAIKNRANKATPGNWEVIRHDDGCEIEIYKKDILLLELYYAENNDDTGRMENAAFIVHARTDIPDLLDYIEKLERINNNYKRIIEAFPSGKNILDLVDNT